jgi:hypothetical protein
MNTWAARHAIAMSIALALVLGLRIQNIDLQPLLGAFDQRFFERYTPYFSGLDAIQTHEIFAPQNAHKKKIVFLGASGVESIGCDYTWHHPEPEQTRNAHYTCSIAAQLNALLKDEHIDAWRAFNLANSGGKMTDELYVYARIVALKPDLVIYGDSFNYYMWENADAEVLSPAHYAYMDEVFERYPETMKIWRSYKANLEKHGWKPSVSSQPTPAIEIGPRYRASTDLNDLILQGLARVRSRFAVDAMPRPVTFDPHPPNRAWNLRPARVPAHDFVNPDAGFGYFQGIGLMAAMQRRSNDNMFFFFVPQWHFVTDLDYQKGLLNEFGSYLKMNGVPFASYVPMEMEPIRETYDGNHHTMMGNGRIAAAILRDLRQARLIP